MIKRYSRKELTDIWSEENKYKIWLDVEVAAAEAMEKLGQIPRGVASIVRKKAVINVNRIHKIESEVKHDVIAFLTSVTEKAGIKARYLHQGMTSSDVLDTSFNIQLVQSGKIILKDMVHDDISFDPKTFHDVVILRSNGIPTYNLTSVVDDADMGITHIIRGDDHLSNTAVQINLFNAFGYKIPVFGHLPMIHGVDGKRLSKRHGAVDINSFLSDGYLVEALINYLVKTGWSHGDDEFFTLDELLKLFTIDKVTKSSAIFDYDKLNWLNQHYIKNKNIKDVTDMIMPYLNSLDVKVNDRKYLENILSLGIDRDYNLKDIANGMTHYFKDKLIYNLDDFPKIDIEKSKDILENVLEKINGNEFKSKEEISNDIKQVCTDMSLKFKDIGPVIRFALTAKLKAPSIDELCFTLGKN